MQNIQEEIVLNYINKTILILSLLLLLSGCTPYYTSTVSYSTGYNHRYQSAPIYNPYYQRYHTPYYGVHPIQPRINIIAPYPSYRYKHDHHEQHHRHHGHHYR